VRLPSERDTRDTSLVRRDETRRVNDVAEIEAGEANLHFNMTFGTLSGIGQALHVSASSIPGFPMSSDFENVPEDYCKLPTVL